MHSFTARAGMTIRGSTGLEDLNVPDRMSTVFFYDASPGDGLNLLDKSYLYNVATYSREVDVKYVYTYCYQPDQSWAKYNRDLNGGTYRQNNYVFTSDCLFRVCIKRCDGASIQPQEASRINEIIAFSPAGGKGAPRKTCAKPMKTFLIGECAKHMA